MPAFDLHRSITSRNALVIVLGACLVLMGRHVYHVYNAGWWGIVAAIGLSLATLQFILRGHKLRGYVFAALDMAYNFAFFGLLTPLLRGQLIAEQAEQILLSVAIPTVLAFYAHDYANKKADGVENDKKSEHIEETPVIEDESISIQEALGIPPYVPSLNASADATVEVTENHILTEGSISQHPTPPPLDPDTKASKRKANTSTSNRARVMAYLNRHGDTTASTLAQKLKVPRGTASVYLADWRKSRVTGMATGD